MADEQKSIPPKSIVLRTLISSQVHSRLTDFAQKYQTGMEKWDYGVAIQILLDFWEYHQKQATVNDINAKVEMILGALEQAQVEEKQEDPNKGKTKLLNGQFV